MLPWQLFEVVRSILLSIGRVKASVYAISFIVWLVGLYQFLDSVLGVSSR